MERELPLIKISVRSLVEFILRSGDIDNRISAGRQKDAMQEGGKMHRKIQRRMGASYQAEVPLKFELVTEDYVLCIEGRADGIITEETVTIDEIKGIYQSLELLKKPVEVHLAQAKCYAYFYAMQHELKEIRVQMTYVQLESEEMKRFYQSFSIEELEVWFEQLAGQYRKWSDFQFQWGKEMRRSARRLQFPYEYRNGQKELAMDVYRTILRKKNLFLQAPTGVGKTLSTLYPAVKAVGEGLADKIFYLTAKTITGTVAAETLSLFQESGYRAKIVRLTAKEKMCPMEEMECNPEHCSFAKGHYDRVNDAVFDLLQKEDFFTREVLLKQAEAYHVCPFEMSLDTSSFADDIICDYNYVFDPNVYLKRFFAEGGKGEYLFLVDEAHNLVERARKMYSEELYKEDILEMRKLVKPYDRKLEQYFTKCNQILLGYKRECEEKILVYEEVDVFIFALMRLMERLDLFLQKNQELPKRKELTEFYLKARNFLNIFERVDEHYVIYGELEEDARFKLKLFCVDPACPLQECLDKGRSTVFFSATLIPIQYYKELLSTNNDNYAIYANSPFSEEKRLLLIGSDVSSKYTRRNEMEFERISSYIMLTIRAKKGNYMIFFPSYQMMQQVYEIFQENMTEPVSLMKQESGMGEEDREAFLREFTKEKEHAMAAFCVMGGIFSEGIDLREEQLIGVIIVGTGLPQISRERELLKNYFERKAGDGFDYAYRYPGMNKVLQAAGRVIRTANDTGVIALLDERFLQGAYQRLFPREWKHYQVCNLNTLGQQVSDFWKKV